MSTLPFQVVCFDGFGNELLPLECFLTLLRQNTDEGRFKMASTNEPNNRQLMTEISQGDMPLGFRSTLTPFFGRYMSAFERNRTGTGKFYPKQSVVLPCSNWVLWDVLIHSCLEWSPTLIQKHSCTILKLLAELSKSAWKIVVM